MTGSCWNLRDLGGLTGIDGRHVREGLVFRSAAIGAAQDDSTPFETTIRYIVDMRTDRERQRHGKPTTVWPDATMWSRDYVTSSADLHSHLIEGPPQRLRQVMIDAYVALPREQAPAIAAIFRAVANRRLPLLVHCAVGKDRTGVAVALLLSALGVSEDAILEDYLRSNICADRIMAELLVHPLLGVETKSRPETLAPLAIADADYLVAMFAALEASYEDVAGYLERVAGIETETLDRVRHILLD